MWDEALERQLLEQFEPVIVATVRRQTSASLRRDDTSARNQDALEMANEARLAVVAWLRSAERAAHATYSAGYVAAVAKTACADYVRRQASDWTRLKNRVRYLLRHDARFALWSGARGVLVCGFAPSVGAAASPLPPGALDAAGDATTLPALVPAVFMRVGGPVTLDALIALLAAHLGVAPPVVSVDEDDGRGAAAVADSTVPIDRVLVHRSALAQLWQDVCALPLRQRVALLLNLRDDNGGDAVALLAVSGVAHLDEIAAVVGLSPEALTDLLPRLPLGDGEIADRLLIQRQQVINLRKAGRARLWRRFLALENRDDRTSTGRRLGRLSGPHVVPR